MNDKLAEAILAELRFQGSQDNALWDASDIANYMECRIICKHHFPRALKVPTTNNGGGRRWLAREVKQWVMKFR
ncbi:hypothetical protein [Veronia pacifica]|uniref:Rha family transcriptional regulator n=1 Tax=Veronia pacifica TaxID=1080227 RepID=A0A1C3EA60_9GAMM|nr:hypothetical protein [Veronia pacifica]ODA30123.1 hypothetical protein A8L45_21010 [Veronia pacifica]